MSIITDGDWTSITITKKRLNGLKLRTVIENRKSFANTLDTILLNSGIAELTDHELEKELKRFGKKMEQVA